MESEAMMLFNERAKALNCQVDPAKPRKRVDYLADRRIYIIREKGTTQVYNYSDKLMFVHTDKKIVNSAFSADAFAVPPQGHIEIFGDYALKSY